MLISRSKVKKYALEKAHEKYKNIPHYMPTRVSSDFLNAAEGMLANWIENFINTRPSKGKTL